MSERPGPDERRNVRRLFVHGLVRAVLVPASAGIAVALLILGLWGLGHQHGDKPPAFSLPLEPILVLWPASFLYFITLLGAMGGGPPNMFPFHVLLVSLNGLFYGVLGIVVQLVLAAVPAAARPGGWAFRWKAVLAGVMILELGLGLLVQSCVSSTLLR